MKKEVAMEKRAKEKMRVCDLCGREVEEGDLCGCDVCGRHFCSSCAGEDPEVCTWCWE